MPPHPPVHGYQSNKTLGRAYLWYWTLGLAGAHHFYLRNTSRGWLYLCTLGLFTVGWFLDMFRMSSLLRASNQDINLQNIAANTAQQQPPR